MCEFRLKIYQSLISVNYSEMISEFIAELFAELIAEMALPSFRISAWVGRDNMD